MTGLPLARSTASSPFRGRSHRAHDWASRASAHRRRCGGRATTLAAEPPSGRPRTPECVGLRRRHRQLLESLGSPRSISRPAAGDPVPPGIGIATLKEFGSTSGALDRLGRRPSEQRGRISQVMRQHLPASPSDFEDLDFVSRWPEAAAHPAIDASGPCARTPTDGKVPRCVEKWRRSERRTNHQLQLRAVSSRSVLGARRP